MEHKQTEEEIKKQLFIEALKATYKREYDRVQPIPYIKDKLYCVDKIFVEGGVEFMVTESASRGRESWERLASYKDIFSDARVSSMRRIFEGEPGYGKTTLTLQLAYDWCQNVRDSPLRDVGILILLRLRQLGGVRSIYRAISVYLVAAERRLRDKDVAEIIRNSSSVVVILDGYDEYPDRGIKQETDVQKVIAMTMFEQMQIILTTRYLPDKYAESTKIIRLTGFDELARDQYIRKAVVGEQNVEGLHNIKRTLKENPVLDDLCQVPLIFVMYAHMADDDPDFENFKTVTSFFKHMISCFHTHLRNKANEPNTRRYLVHENKHEALDQLAFSGLSEKIQQISWDKNELCGKLGVGFYNVYVSIGVLVEEEVICSTENDMHSTTEVRFYHKLFCEWYAAHHLGNTLSQPRQDLSIDGLLCCMDPFDLQYVYRLACGINADAGKKLIDYLNTKKNMDRFAILCILERAGDVEDILPAVQEICSKTVIIRHSYNRLLQRSNQQLLDIASAYNIPVVHLHLLNSFDRFDVKSNCIVLMSRLLISKMNTVAKIELEANNLLKQFEGEEFLGLLRFAHRCGQLKELLFQDHGRLVLPLSIPVDHTHPLRKTANFQVLYQKRFGLTYRLSLENGHWEIHNTGVNPSLRVQINLSDTEEVQQWCVQELTIASAAGVPIQKLQLHEIFRFIDKNKQAIVAYHDCTIPALQTLRRLEVSNSSLVRSEFIGLLEYTQWCPDLITLRFLCCELPDSVDPGMIPPLIKQRRLTVAQNADYGHPDEELNLETGKWEVGDGSSEIQYRVETLGVTTWK